MRQVQSTGASNWIQFTHLYVQKTNIATGTLKEDRIMDSRRKKQGTPRSQINKGHKPELGRTKVTPTSTRLRRRGMPSSKVTHNTLRAHSCRATRRKHEDRGVTRPPKPNQGSKHKPPGRNQSSPNTVLARRLKLQSAYCATSNRSRSREFSECIRAIVPAVEWSVPYGLRGDASTPGLSGVGEPEVENLERMAEACVGRDWKLVGAGEIRTPCRRSGPGGIRNFHSEWEMVPPSLATSYRGGDKCQPELLVHLFMLVANGEHRAMGIHLEIAHRLEHEAAERKIHGSKTTLFFIPPVKAWKTW
ncbi:hypothetical protein T265_01392 [Opisthorchis viverrini]|uniref:Uncharacterized protein n=1 Tax=Opisthorchis viverrini TaxID=6198 RepID=A0A075AIZ9_OPIVI|nr:hypothetical protein T265_01392 [Opisthorchis viverrini]KER32514.1 hypothetical protein T265_01392 [Opisthorchis viverrini]